MSAANLLDISRRNKESLKVYNPNVLRDLLDTSSKPESRAASAPENSSRGALTKSNGPSVPSPAVGSFTAGSMVSDSRTVSLTASMGDTLRDRARAQREARMETLRERDAQFQTQLKQQTEERRRRHDARFDSEFAKVLADVAGESPVMQDTQYTLNFSDRTRRKKQEGLYNEWDREVFGKLQGRLQQSLAEREPRDIERVWNEEYGKYLNTTNTKVGVFRDVIIEQDYNPFHATNRTIKVPTGDIRDPVKRDLQKRIDEHRMIQSGPSSSAGGPGTSSSGSLSGLDPKLGRETLDTSLWGSDRIRATPHCHCVDETGQYVLRPPPDELPRGKLTTVSLDQYEYPTGRACTDKEMGKWRGIALGPEVRRGRRDLMEVIQWRRPGDKSFPGDLWLEQRGRRTGVDMEDSAAGAAPVSTDISDVVGHRFLLGATAPPDPPQAPHVAATMGKRRVAAALQRGAGVGILRDKTVEEVAADVSLPYGDKWMDYRGRRSVPGPEELRGRRDLSETLKQASNPYEDGRTLDDSWLEYKGRRCVPPEKQHRFNPIVGV